MERLFCSFGLQGFQIKSIRLKKIRKISPSPLPLRGFSYRLSKNRLWCAIVQKIHRVKTAARLIATENRRPSTSCACALNIKCSTLIWIRPDRPRDSNLDTICFTNASHARDSLPFLGLFAAIGGPRPWEGKRDKIRKTGHSEIKREKDEE
ncbi:unnamed protein product [Nesidiocoris tenuis]|uniref:Uncharacterized protein n=1 Tax=Nesidiocoris tenuis TaxID=355587 RepID=A0A6H5GAK6_9HEMI|nr:unnamed protein product [Nesidiocoris tenuis]